MYFNYKKYIPIFSWVKKYRKSWITGDLSAGFTVGVMLIPQGMAYALLAGLPPIYGLYASTIPLLIYAVFGTSRQLAVGPVAMISLLVMSGVSQWAELGSEEYIALTILLALMVGLIQFSMGLLRLGFIVNFLSHPVIVGFTTGAAVIIGFSQLKHLLGIDIPRGQVHEIFKHTIHINQDVNPFTLALGLASFILLILLKRVKKQIPGPIIVVIMGIGSMVLFNLTQYGVQIVGDVPDGLPAFRIPEITLESVQMLLPGAMTIAFIGFIESIAIARIIMKKHNNYKLHNNQELIGLGLANIAGSFFQSFPVTGGFSRSAVNDQAGAKTGLASIFSAILVVITLLFLTKYFYYLPTAVLSAIIMVAVIGLIDLNEAKYLWKTDKKDFMLFIITALGTVSLGVEKGILLGAILSMIVVIYNISYPHVAVLGRSIDGKIYRNIERFKEVEQLNDTLIIRFDAQLYFANINYFKDFVWTQIQQHKHIKHFILDARAINTIDSSSIHALKEIIEEMREKDIVFYMVDVKGPVRDKLYKSQLVSLIGKPFLLNNIDEAVSLIKQNAHPVAENRSFAIQTNMKSKD